MGTDPDALKILYEQLTTENRQELGEGFTLFGGTVAAAGALFGAAVQIKSPLVAYSSGLVMLLANFLATEKILNVYRRAAKLSVHIEPELGISYERKAAALWKGKGFVAWITYNLQYMRFLIYAILVGGAIFLGRYISALKEPPAYPNQYHLVSAVWWVILTLVTFFITRWLIEEHHPSNPENRFIKGLQQQEAARESVRMRPGGPTAM